MNLRPFHEELHRRWSKKKSKDRENSEMAKKGKQLHGVHIILHHGGDPAGSGDEHGGGELNDGFEIEHRFKDNEGNEFLESKGMTHSHGDVMQHVHDMIRGHGADGEQQDELSGGAREQGSHGAREAHEEETGHSREEDGGDCAYCAREGAKDIVSGGEHELNEAHLANISRHGYERGSVNDVRHSAKHPGFKPAQKKIASKEHLSSKAAGAILASRTRGASKAAHHANPRLSRVKG